jgi:16S rRNA (cytosine1402-N4)-methyltransferase
MSDTDTTASPDPTFHHRPVMEREIVDVFSTVPPGVIVDATLGGAGHSVALLQSRLDLRIVGIDQDEMALAAARRRLAPFGDRASVHHLRFDRLASLMTDLQTRPITGVLFDLGVSSPQLDQPERGFSYRADAPLDMRMDRHGEWSAHDIVNGYDAMDLVRILRDHADERFADRIAAAIVAARPIETTAELADIVAAAIPAAARRRGGHPAKRTFQAIRIEVNAELAILPGAIDDAIDVVDPGGRVAVLSYHSGEDRIVKERFKTATNGGCVCPPALPCVCGAIATMRLVRVPKRPSADEQASNRRAESARLRVAERLAD